MNRLAGVFVAGFVVVSVVVLAPVAHGCGGDGCGGLVLEWEQPYYKPGEVVRGVTLMNWPKVSKRSVGAYEAGPYNIYLRPMRSRLGSNPERDPSALPVGTLTLGPLKRYRLSSVEAEFTVPSVAGGRYFVDYCAPGCKLRPGILSGSELILVTNEVEERAFVSDQIDRVERLTMRASSTAYRFRFKARKELRKAKVELQSKIQSAEADARDLQEQLERLRRRVTAEPTPREDQLGSMVVAGSILTAGVMLRRRRRRPSPTLP